MALKSADAYELSRRGSNRSVRDPFSPGGREEWARFIKARDSRLRRIIALKTLPAEKVADADRKRRFLLEAQAASRLNHPNTVTI